MLIPPGEWDDSGKLTTTITGVPNRSYYLGVFTNADSTMVEESYENNSKTAMYPQVSPGVPVLHGPSSAKREGSGKSLMLSDLVVTGSGLDVTVSTLKGRAIYSRHFASETGRLTKTIDVGTRAAGTYWVRVVGDETQLRQKLTIR